MIRYVGAALALKAFSLNGATRDLYRRFGNRFGGPLRRRDSYLRSHVTRGELLLDLTERYGLRRGGERLLEIGTGWVHWHSLYQRLHTQARITAFDIWDCRQFDSLQTLFGEFARRGSELGARPLPEHGEQLLRDVLASDDFPQLYARTGLDYRVDDDGSIASLADGSFDAIFSFHTLEHVPKVERLVDEMFAALRPGGYCIHQIGIDDHLTHYDPGESPKNYVRYSDFTWKLLFENQIQFHNRMQPSEFLKVFDARGFEAVEVTPGLVPAEQVPRPSSHFERFSQEDLRCTVLTIVHRKPAV